MYLVSLATGFTRRPPDPARSPESRVFQAALHLASSAPCADVEGRDARRSPRTPSSSCRGQFLPWCRRCSFPCGGAPIWRPERPRDVTGLGTNPATRPIVEASLFIGPAVKMLVGPPTTAQVRGDHRGRPLTRRSVVPCRRFGADHSRAVRGLRPSWWNSNSRPLRPPQRTGRTA